MEIKHREMTPSVHPCVLHGAVLAREHRDDE